MQTLSILPSSTTKTSQSELFSKDKWEPQDIGLKPDTVHSFYHLNFGRLQPDWFKHAVKQFICFQSATRTLATCQSYLVGLANFSTFLMQYDAEITPEQINRRLVTEYVGYLACRSLSVMSRQMALVHLRTFHTVMIREKWLPLPAEPLIYSSDFPKGIEHLPRFIPETVIKQLQMHLPHLPSYMQRFITILLETGRRVGEICTLPFDCLEADKENDYFLRVNDRKPKKVYLIPISSACLSAIQTQQSAVKNEKKMSIGYLFPAKRVTAQTPHLSARTVNSALNVLAIERNILDEKGQLWHFHSHQFRHTVGTRMINAGVPQPIVQRYLGHESPEMTARYAHLHDEILKSAFNEYQGKLVTIQGKIYPMDNQHKDARWLQHNIMAQALPNGLCALPSPKQRCPHANACLTCTHFRTHEKFLPQHQAQLEETNRIITAAQANGWQRQVEMNESVKKNLEKIIETLSTEKHNHVNR